MARGSECAGGCRASRAVRCLERGEYAIGANRNLLPEQSLRRTASDERRVPPAPGRGSLSRGGELSPEPESHHIQSSWGEFSGRPVEFGRLIRRGCCG